MSEWDQQALASNFEGWRKERAPNLSLDQAFERYSIEHVLKDADLSDEELEYGLVGGVDDGGVDGIYFFINRTLMQDETEVPDRALSAELIIIQAKNKDGFEEDAVSKLADFTRDLLDYNKPSAKFKYYSQSIRDAIDNFREKYSATLGSTHEVTVTYYYITKSDADVHPKVLQRAEVLKQVVRKQLSAASVTVDFWGCKKLLAAARSVPKANLTMTFSEQLSTKDGSVICLVNLQDYAAFLADDRGNLRRSLLEPNVRDYQGKQNTVNQDIRKTLTTDKGEFWWLNNGVTILASSCNTSGNRLTIEMPEIVNGLQTSQEIFEHFAAISSSAPEVRHILVRVILPPDELTRNRVTKATNNQTPVSALSLKATDQIHFDIEERLRLYDVFYDRRKGQYRNQRKPISKIVTVKAMAQSVMAALLRRPNDAYGSPLKLLKQEDNYELIFSDQYNRDLYVACALLDKAVIEFLDGEDYLTRYERRALRYYVIMWLACDLTDKAEPSVEEIAKLSLKVIISIPRARFEAAISEVLTLYKSLGGTEKVAKGPALKQKLQEKIADRLSV